MKLRTLVLAFGMVASGLVFSAQSALASNRGTTWVENKVRHELNMLPYVNAFDYMSFTVDEDNNVTLIGEVTNPTLKSDAGNVVKRIEGVEHVDNQIKVLPVSFFVDRDPRHPVTDAYRERRPYLVALAERARLRERKGVHLDDVLAQLREELRGY